MEVFFVWILFSLLVGAIGSDRKIGFWGAFFLSLILSPIIGLIITVVSPTKAKIAQEKETLELLRAQDKREREKAGEEPKEVSFISEEEQVKETWKCPICSVKNEKTESYCLDCGYRRRMSD